MRQQEEDMCGANRALTRHLEDTQVSISPRSGPNIIMQIQQPYLRVSVDQMAYVLFVLYCTRVIRKVSTYRCIVNQKILKVYKYLLMDRK